MFYTYLWLREDRTPYYVGKGKGNRGFTSKQHRLKCPPKDRIIIQGWPSEELAFEAEKALIKYYGRIDLGTGCLSNLTEGGDNPPKRFGPPSEDVREKIRKALTGRHLSQSHKNKLREVNLGKTLTEECKKKMSKVRKGHSVSEETRKKISIGHKGRKYSVEVRARMSAGQRARVPPSVETKERISESMKRVRQKQRDEKVREILGK
jgi:hypothetical protein